MLTYYLNTNEPVTESQLLSLTCVEYLKCDLENNEIIEKLRKDRNFTFEDEIEVKIDDSIECKNKLKAFFEEHLHKDDEIRLILKGVGYFDVRDINDQWIRIEVHSGDLIILPTGIYHRFSIKDFLHYLDNYVANNNDYDHRQYNNNRPSFLRITKQRKTANKKERRRTQSINNAFLDLRDCIPSIPSDTKLSKIKTLRLATSYISHLSEILANDKNANNTHDFQVDIATQNSKKSLSYDYRPTKQNSLLDNGMPSTSNTAPIYISYKTNNVTDNILLSNENNRKILEASLSTKGRTGWPEYVWALELKSK